MEVVPTKAPEKLTVVKNSSSHQMYHVQKANKTGSNSSGMTLTMLEEDL